MGNTRKPGGGRKPSKPEYSAAKNLTQQMEAAADLYMDKMSLQAIADALALNPIKVRKLLITAGVYESDTAKLVRQTFNAFRETQSYSAAVTSTMSALQLSRPSVTSYLPYEKGVYFPEEAEAMNISAGAERQRHYRAVTALKKNPCEENLWKCVVAFRGYKFKTLSGLPFTYKLKKGRGDEFTKELWIDRREGSKSLAWSSVLLAYHNIGKIGEVVDRPKALGDCINRCEFAICTEKTCHSIGDFPPPRRPPSTKKLCRQSHRQSSEILIFYFGYRNIVLL